MWTALLGVLLATTTPPPQPETLEEGFLHQVFFWLKEPDNPQARREFLEALTKMKAIPTIQRWHVGTPAGTPRDVVDNSWTFSLLVTFKDRGGWQVYNDHPIHDEFRTKAYLWERIQVYDVVPAEN